MEERCYAEFWSKNKQLYDEVMASLLAAEAQKLNGTTLMVQFVQWVRENVSYLGGNSYVELCTDTAGFDIGFLNAYLPVTTPSMNYLLTEGVYNGITDVHSFAKGVAAMGHSMSLIKEDDFKEGTWAAAQMVVWGKNNPNFPVFTQTHSHNPMEDAGYIAEQYGTLRHGLEKKKYHFQHFLTVM